MELLLTGKLPEYFEQVAAVVSSGWASFAVVGQPEAAVAASAVAAIVAAVEPVVVGIAVAAVGSG